MSDEIFKEFGADPIALMKEWYAEAEPLEPNDPEAVTLATAAPDGKPSCRWVLHKEISDMGLKFHTNADSRKGQELAANPYAAMNYYWKSTRKQIRIEGHVEQVSEAEADDYFITRSTERQIGAWASKQSQPYDTRAELEGAIERYAAEFEGANSIPRPPYWLGYRLIPSSIEFWISHRDRLHTRFIYKKGADNQWSAHYLYP